MKVTKSPTYKSGIRPMLGGDKKRAVKFDKGLKVEVSEEEFENINKLGWCDGDKTTFESTEDRDIAEGQDVEPLDGLDQ